MTKNFLIDTNVLMRSPNSIFVFKENNVFVCHSTLEELDNLKTRGGETGYSAREAIRTINELRQHGDLTKGIKLEHGGVFKVIPDAVQTAEGRSVLPMGWPSDKADNRIIATAIISDSILVTNDISLIVKAEAAGAKTENYKHEEVSDSSMKYTGRSTVFAHQDVVNNFYKEDGMFISDLYEPEKIHLHINEFVVIQDITNPKHTALGRFDGENIVKLKYAHTNPFDVKPKNVGQTFAIEALLTPAEEVPLTVLIGKAGTAKTFLALAAGLQKVMHEEEYNRLLLLRPNVKFDEDIGYLKGTEMDKILPLIRPCLDNLEVLLSTSKDSKIMAQSKIDELFERGYIAAEALAYLRGRSIHNQFLLIDEAQNSTPLQAMGIITRAGMGTKIVIVGDPDQIDNPKLDRKNNGLVYSAEKMLDSKLCMQLRFDEEECVRSPLAQEASLRLKK